MTMSITTLSSTVYTNLVSSHVGRGRGNVRQRYVLCTRCHLLYVSSNFIYMNHGTLYIYGVSQTHSATCHSGIYLLSQYYFGTDSRCSFHYESRAIHFG